MTELVPGAGFPIARCAPCGRDVLTHVDLDGDGVERRSCVHCDAGIDPDEVRWVAEAALDDLGYALQRDGCGRPGCGGGRCQRSE